MTLGDEGREEMEVPMKSLTARAQHRAIAIVTLCVLTTACAGGLSRRQGQKARLLRQARAGNPGASRQGAAQSSTRVGGIGWLLGG